MKKNQTDKLVIVLDDNQYQLLKRCHFNLYQQQRIIIIYTENIVRTRFVFYFYLFKTHGLS